MTSNRQQDQQGQQDQQDQQNQQRAAPGNAGHAQRSENLLPAEDDGDGRFDVAEEVNLDEQSDTSRRVGKAPAGATAEAMAEALKGGGKDGS